jgi:hypothetical protein
MMPLEDDTLRSIAELFQQPDIVGLAARIIARRSGKY